MAPSILLINTIHSLLRHACVQLHPGHSCNLYLHISLSASPIRIAPVCASSVTYSRQGDNAPRRHSPTNSAYTFLLQRNQTALLHILEEILDSGKRLLATGDYLFRRQHESILARVPQLSSKRVVALDDVGHEVDTAPASLVNRLANRARVEPDLMHGEDGVDGSPGQRLDLGVIGCLGVARVPVCY